MRLETFVAADGFMMFLGNLYQWPVWCWSSLPVSAALNRKVVSYIYAWLFWRSWTWGFDDKWAMMFTEYKACGWELGSRFQMTSLYACAVHSDNMSHHGRTLHLWTSWVYFCPRVFASSIYCIRSSVYFNTCLLKSVQYLPEEFQQMTWFRPASCLCKCTKFMCCSLSCCYFVQQ
jgi:hypothetical protein